jgi:hypothetical protein
LDRMISIALHRPSRTMTGIHSTHSALGKVQRSRRRTFGRTGGCGAPSPLNRDDEHVASQSVLADGWERKLHNP